MKNRLRVNVMETGRFEMTSRPRRIGTIAKVSALACIAPFIVFGISGLRISTSPSLPIELYRITSDEYAPLVEFCPVEPYASFAAARGYRSKGTCPDGASPLMKPVVAKAGDRVRVSKSGLEVNGRLLPNSVPMAADTKKRPMTIWPVGDYTVAPGWVWVASSYNARSFDSRYFGPVRTTEIRCHLKSFLVLP
jgi:conjugative transfer signal peptidase TraF